MNKNVYPTKVHFLPLLLTLAAFASFSFSAGAQAFTQGFDVMVPLPTGWAQQNLSTPVGMIPNWIQGDNTIFPAQNGATNSYAACSFQSISGAGTISNWLFTPTVTLSNGDVLTFYTRSVAGSTFPDRMQVRMSTNGASVNVGATSTSVGDFTTLLLDINSGLAVGGYPVVWTQFTITLSGLGAPVSGRFAFRYFVTNGGPSGSNSDYIGLDNVVYTPNGSMPITLTDFSAYPDGSRNQLRWTTSNEQDNSGFEVQRSADGINFTVLDFVKSQAIDGNSNSRLNYTFTDHHQNSDRQYYRLRQVDFDGRSTVSNVVLIKRKNPLLLRIEGIFPNPASTMVHVQIAGPEEDRATLIITDITGKTLIQQAVHVETGSHSQAIDISSLPAGTYLMKLICSNECESEVSRFVKQ